MMGEISLFGFRLIHEQEYEVCQLSKIVARYFVQRPKAAWFRLRKSRLQDTRSIIELWSQCIQSATTTAVVLGSSYRHCLLPKRRAERKGPMFAAPSSTCYIRGVTRILKHFLRRKAVDQC